jgi:hypothetical protein
MTWVSSQISYADAVALGLPVWEVLVSNWGDTRAASNGDVAFPAIGLPALPTVHGVSIGPRSMVNRAYVAYDRQKNITAPYSYLREVSVEAPLLFTQPAAGGAVFAPNVFPPFSAASVAVLNSQVGAPVAGVDDPGNDSFSIGANYISAAGAATAFGTNGGAVWVPPLMHLYFHLTPFGAQVPTKRPRDVHSARINVVTGAERPVAQVPVCGREKLFIQVTSAAAGNTDFRIGLIPLIRTAREVTVATAAAVPANTPTRFVVNPAKADFVMIYANSAATGFTEWQVCAED